MFKGFNLSGFDLSFFNSSRVSMLVEFGRMVTSNGEKEVRETLAEMVNSKAPLNGARIQKTWFPQVSANVFICHSHRNEEIALALAAWLKINFDLVPFVDSAVWNYAGHLIRTIDNNYCWQRESKTYNYLRRNESTSHVHAMLVTALGMMIHRTECLIFLNTPESIASTDVIAKTYSPWIYAELTMAGIIEETTPMRHRDKATKLAAAGAINESREWPGILHEIEALGRLREISRSTLLSWLSRCKVKGEDALDDLYYLAT